MTTSRDLDRQVIKSESASIKIKELEFEIPPNTQKGEITTLEGILKTAAANLSLHQSERLALNPDVGLKVANVIMELTNMSIGSRFPFTIVVDDPAGNSYIENFFAPSQDPMMTLHHYFRTSDLDVSLGLQPDKGVFRDDKDSNFKELMNSKYGFGMKKQPEEQRKEEEIKVEEEEEVRLGRTEVVSIPSHCPNCSHLGESLTALTDIPHFKEVIIMAFDCKICGYRNNEVKGGGAVPTKGNQVELKVQNSEDLKRDLLKSDSAMVLIPELDLVRYIYTNIIFNIHVFIIMNNKESDYTPSLLNPAL